MAGTDDEPLEPRATAARECRVMGGGMSQARCTLGIPGLDCPNEIEALRRALSEEPGIAGLSFDLIHATLTVDYDPNRTSPERLAAAIVKRSGLRAAPVGAPEPAASWWSQNERLVLTAGSGTALAAAYLAAYAAPALGIDSGLSHRLSLMGFGLAIAIGGVGLFPRAARNALQLRMGIDVLMSLAIIGAVCLGEWDEAATVAFLYGLSELLESLSLERARRSVRALLEVAPTMAERIGEDGQVTTTPASAITRGDRVLVRSGDVIPVDGVVTKGRSSVDEKTITGESIPAPREAGDFVHAGTVNGEGTLEVRADGPVGDSVVARVIDQVRSARAGRAAIERRITRFAAIYTPIVVGVSLVVMIGPLLGTILTSGWTALDAALVRDWVNRGLVVLVISCPCALVIATPVAIVCGLAAAARRGILIRGGEFLEQVGRLSAIAFDKTGTLTAGRPDVVEVVCAAGAGDQDRLLSIAAALGDRGGHVLGKAIARHARDRALAVPVADDYQAIPGLGALGRVEDVEYHLGSHRYIDQIGMCEPDFHDELHKAEDSVGSAVAVSASSGPLGFIRLADRPRPEAARVLTELQSLGLRTVMLTGDNQRTAAAMARELGLSEERSGLLPADKVRAIAEIDAHHGPTGMVGDGVNDAPALAAAKVSIALGGVSSGAALESADIVLLADDLGRLPWLVRHGRKVLARIRQNIAIALVIKAAVLVAALFGIANLWMAVVSDVGTSILVVFNALRLLRQADA